MITYEQFTRLSTSHVGKRFILNGTVFSLLGNPSQEFAFQSFVKDDNSPSITAVADASSEDSRWRIRITEHLDIKGYSACIENGARMIDIVDLKEII